MRLHKNPWADFLIKLGSICAAVLAVAKMLVYFGMPLVTAAWAEMERPMSARMAHVEAVEDKLTVLIEEHEKEDARNREDLKALVQIIAAPPDSPERKRRAKAFIASH